ncbi:MAG TPA: DUF1553 domain-containing protein [Verrucomicrobiae bacterium]|nr:DUF1553 domain-containing protein [Verrucomicrobiae bacterium]
MPSLGKVVAFFGVWIGTVVLLDAASPDAKISFSRQIQPLLSEYCYQCHGPDSAARKPKRNPLRLDRAQFAFAPRGEGQPAIIKGSPAESEVVRRLRSADPDEVMPPASAHKTVKAGEIALIERWIQEGADYEEHWAFQPIKRPEVPVAGSSWARSPIDHFIAAKLDERGLAPNAEEQRARLLRRLTFDLTGLPPAPRDVDGFFKDTSPAAYEKAVNRLLASEACAEHFARQWLDAVRYADTQGIHHDHYRSVWPYRDWVIGAFMTNMAFDRFTIEQLGGDLLPSASLEQKVASGFNRLLPTTGEGGAIPEEYNTIYAKDRVDTTSAVWLGLTTGCASCHDHKFDPITMRDFYSMTAFFRNNTLRALDDSRGRDYPPTIFVPSPPDRARWPQLQQFLAGRTNDIKARQAAARPDFDKWLATANPNRWERALRPGLLLHLPLTEMTGPAQGKSGRTVVEWPTLTNRHAGFWGPAPLITGSGAAVQGAAPLFQSDGHFSYGGFLYIEGKPNGAVVSRMNAADKFRGWDLFLTDGKPTVHIVDQFPDAALKVTAREALPAKRWNHVMVVFDGGGKSEKAGKPGKGSDAVSLYVNGRKMDVEVNNNTLGSNIVAEVPLRIGARSDAQEKTAQVLEKGRVFLQDLRVYDRALDPSEVARLCGIGRLPDYRARPAAERGTNETAEVFQLYLAGFDPPSLKLQKEMALLKSEERLLRDRGGLCLVMEEKKDTLPVAHVLMRGNYTTKGNEVPAATPEVLGPMPASAPRNRLGLAQWLVSSANPLPARVTANRAWQYLFGVGLVETSEDFGIMGARPTHRELLDWLAAEFLESGWNYRQLVKTIVMSAAYRQSARITPEKLEKDPLNRWISRGPRSRLEAEAIRDQALAASGLLVRKIGGPPVKPYQPEGVWEAVAMKDSNTRVYKADDNEGLYRRSLYTFWKRTAPPASMEILNAPSREVFCVRRERSNTPLQALVTMNDPQLVEAARQLATRVLKDSRRFEQRADALALALLSRRFTPEERGVIRQMLDRARVSYERDAEAAMALLEVGESKPDPSLPPGELAAWSLVASQVMNLDEALTK